MANGNRTQRRATAKRHGLTGEIEVIEGVTVDGQAFAVVVEWCNDPNCPEHRFGQADR